MSDRLFANRHQPQVEPARDGVSAGVLRPQILDFLVELGLRLRCGAAGAEPRVDIEELVAALVLGETHRREREGRPQIGDTVAPVDAAPLKRRAA